MSYKDIPIGKNPPKEVNAYIENPVGGAPVKYELDKESGEIFVDRFLHTEMRYPGNYGFVPHTLSEDGDPVDILIIGDTPVMPGAVMPVRPIGVLIMEDEQGMDEKIIAVPVDRLLPQYKDVKNYDDLPDILVQKIEHFFKHYKDLEPGKWVKTVRWGDAKEAEDMIDAGIDREDRARQKKKAAGKAAAKKRPPQRKGPKIGP